MSEEKGNTLRIELDGKLENLDLYENIVLQSNSKLNHILPTKNETMSSKIKPFFSRSIHEIHYIY